ncbi:MAG: FG-GAP-like repeat-containing protein [Verrucomicrobiota bacterium]|nr:FG-GAP-like repeat-containing protein [Verrucomicrobiota bacterium]
MNWTRLGVGFTLVKSAPAVILPRMTEDSGTGQAPSQAKYLLLLIAVVLAPVVFTWLTSSPTQSDADFDLSINAGKTHYEAGEAQESIDAFTRALKFKPTETDLLLNLANAHRLANHPLEVIKYAKEALAIDPNLDAGHFLIGCAHLRLDQVTEATKALQQAYYIDNTVGAVGYLLGKAQLAAGNAEEAAMLFEEVAAFETDHLGAAYALSQALTALDRSDEAKAALELHQQRIAGKKMPDQPGHWEMCSHTEVRIPFKLSQPDASGIAVQFVDDTAKAFAGNADKFIGPFGVIDFNHDGNNSLFVRTRTNTFRTLLNTNAVFTPLGFEFPAIEGAHYSRCLVGDLNNDRFDDVLMLGNLGSHAYRFATNGLARDLSKFSKLASLKAIDGVIADIDFTGKLDLLVIQPGDAGLKILRNLGSIYFKDITKTSGIPTQITGALKLVMDDWNNDDMLDLFIPLKSEPPMFMQKNRGAVHSPTNTLPTLPTASALATGDLNNDLRVDLVCLASGKLEITFNGLEERQTLPLAKPDATAVSLFDYDNDGWLDLFTIGDGVQAFRNQGTGGFTDVTAALGLDSLTGQVTQLAAADIDRDGDSDLLLAHVTGLKYLRNDGGNANRQLKIRLYGNRSNASGIGIQVETVTTGLRLKRTVQSLPIEIGIGKNKLLHSLNARWFDLSLFNLDVKVKPSETLTLTELILPTGSCPYLYAWDGEKHRFVTDLLGASPLGLPVAEGVYIDAHPDEIVWIGDETNFQPIEGNYQLQLTEELREILYLDEAKLLAVDVPIGTEVHPTTKLLQKGPYPPAGLTALAKRKPLRQAKLSDGLDVTAALLANDDQWVSPVELRLPQLRGFAKPYSIEFDFGPLDTGAPLALAMTGWLHFGGGMANIAASHHSDLPFPFPKLEAQVANGTWQKINVTVGAPVGKTKTIVVDLAGKLPNDAKRLRLSMAFEIHWNRIALFEKTSLPSVATMHPTTTDLHWHGYGAIEDLPSHLPLTPIHDQTGDMPNWRITPSGWVTRYGDVNELIAVKDNRLALIAAGDELTLGFTATKLPMQRPHTARQFFLFTSGWDKDADFHVAHGWTVEPLPWQGMDAQRYGREPRPKLDDGWIKKYNTRWIGPRPLNKLNKLTISK